MKVLPINNVHVNNVKHNDNVKKMATLPETVEPEQTLTNPTFKGCGITAAIMSATCAILGSVK